jgi:predicted dinucleotide-binding enzyme
VKGNWQKVMTQKKFTSRKIALIGAGKIGKLGALLLGKKYNVSYLEKSTMSLFTTSMKKKPKKRPVRPAHMDSSTLTMQTS